MKPAGKIALGLGSLTLLLGAATLGTDALEKVVFGLGAVGVAVAIPGVRRWFTSGGEKTEAEVRLEAAEARLLLTQEQLDYTSSEAARLREELEFDRQLTRPRQPPAAAELPRPLS
jgi:hypothetical protein